MNQKQIIDKFNSYKSAVGNDSEPAAILLLVEVLTNLNIGIKKQAWKDLADEISDL